MPITNPNGFVGGGVGRLESNYFELSIFNCKSGYIRRGYVVVGRHGRINKIDYLFELLQQQRMLETNMRLFS